MGAILCYYILHIHIDNTVWCPNKRHGNHFSREAAKSLRFLNTKSVQNALHYTLLNISYIVILYSSVSGSRICVICFEIFICFEI